MAGTDSAGGSGTNYGVAFSGSNAYPGFPGFLTNLPSGNQALFDEAGDYVNVAAGFTTGFSFFYTTSSDNLQVIIYDGLNGTGNVLATILTPANYSNGGCANPSDFIYCHWDPVGVGFAGTAKSIQLGSNHMFYDNMTFGSAIPEGATATVPEPEPWSLMLVAFGALGAARRKRTEQ